jgi:hypothetical protein
MVALLIVGMADTDTARALHSTVLKGKAIPLQAWTGLESSRRLRLLDFKTNGT